jgi:hypothetical protein
VRGFFEFDPEACRRQRQAEAYRTLKMGKQNGHKTETPDVSHIRNVEVMHETSDINVSGVLKFVAALTIGTIAVYIGMVFLFNLFNKQAQEPQPGPMALTKQERLPPEPRLQAAPGFAVTLDNGKKVDLELRVPQAEYRVLHEEWQQQLNSGAMPIDDAIKKISGTLPVRTKDGSTKLSDYAENFPTAASSGRETEKRLQ